MRCIYESLALKYRFALGQLEAATGRRFAALHVLGGGAKDGLLCRMTADATACAQQPARWRPRLWAISSSSLWRWACCRPLMRDGGSLQKQNV